MYWVTNCCEFLVLLVFLVFTFVIFWVNTHLLSGGTLKICLCIPYPPNLHPHHHLRSSTEAHMISYSPLLDLKWFSLVWEMCLVTCSFDRTNDFVVFQSNAAARGSLPAAVGRCSVSQCPGSVTAGRHARTRATRWTVPVSTAYSRPPLRYLTSITRLISGKNSSTLDLFALGWSDHSWMALNAGVNAPSMFKGHTGT